MTHGETCTRGFYLVTPKAGEVPRQCLTDGFKVWEVDGIRRLLEYTTRNDDTPYCDEARERGW